MMMVPRWSDNDGLEDVGANYGDSDERIQDCNDH